MEVQNNLDKTQLSSEEKKGIAQLQKWKAIKAVSLYKSPQMKLHLIKTRIIIKGSSMVIYNSIFPSYI